MFVHWQFHLCTTQSLWLNVADRLSVSKRLSWNLILQSIISLYTQANLLSLKFHSKGCPRSARGTCFTLLSYYPKQGPLINPNTTFNSRSYGHERILSIKTNVWAILALRSFHMENCRSIAYHRKPFMRFINRHVSWYDTSMTRKVISFQNLSISYRAWLKGFGQVRELCLPLLP